MEFQLKRIFLVLLGRFHFEPAEKIQKLCASIQFVYILLLLILFCVPIYRKSGDSIFGDTYADRQTMSYTRFTYNENS